eukprot:TRINITY_DN5347_c0_g1_i2.p1 TRINITY_DN5347_c0_g1~~TRINITY_DN5347_c0_g1_i2.p1  ORF type:complete len:618 (+),score=103.53 TRINITY_DN5347_c0_g1_i2:79-1932(+)
MSSPESRANSKQHVHAVKSVGSTLSNLAIDGRFDLELQPDAVGLRERLANLLASPGCNVFLFGIIILNIIFVVIETDAAPDSALSVVLEWLNRICLLVYAVELSVRVYVHGTLWFHSFAHIVDIAFVGADLILMVTQLSGQTVANISAFRVVRIVRARKFTKALRSHPEFREFYIIMNGFEGAMRAIASATLLIISMLTIWSVLAVKYVHPYNKELAETTSVYDGCNRCKRAFETVPQAILTFTQQIVAGDSWGQVSVPVLEAYPATGFIFGGVLVSVNLGLMNLILSVIVDKANAASEDDRAYQLQLKQAEFAQAKDGMLELCRKMDEDGGGTLTLEELERGYAHFPEFQETLAIMDVSLEDMENLFNVMDEDQSGSVSYDEFVEQLYKMKCQDSHILLVFMRSHIKDMRQKVQKSVDLLQDKVLQELNCQKVSILEIQRMIHKLVEVPPQIAEAKSLDSKLADPVKSMPRCPLGEFKADQEFAKLQSHLQAANDVVSTSAAVLNASSASLELQSLKGFSVDLELQRLRQHAIDWEQSLTRLIQTSTQQAHTKNSGAPAVSSPPGRSGPQLRSTPGVFMPQCCSTETSKPEQAIAVHGSQFSSAFSPQVDASTRRV